MHLSRTSLSSLASTALFAWAQAKYLSNEHSFGHDTKITPNNDQSIPHFQLQGKPNTPQVLSNKIVLTPPAPGNQRGAVWGTNRLEYSQWELDLDFRATGPERGSGNLQIWYANLGDVQVGTSSIYTVGKFDGLALVIDQYSGSAGTIRGFLNDGTTDYKSHHSVDSLAFGHCSYSYRNLGRPSSLAIRHSSSAFRVEIDGNLCFDSTKIKLPTNYNFGISAASAETPDSFEVFKFVTNIEKSTPDNQVSTPRRPIPMRDGGQARAQADDTATSDIKSSDAQFAYLHDHLQGLESHFTTLNADLSSLSQVSSSYNSDLLSRLNNIEALMSSSISRLEGKIDKIGEDVRQTKSELHNSFEKHVAGLKQGMREGSEGIVGSVKEGKMGWWGMLGLVVLGQLGTVAGYAVYKRGKKGGSKKYL